MKVIEIRNLHYTYPDGTKALKGISIDIEKGESVGIIGANGAGKSTFLLNLNGILKGRAEKFVVLGQGLENANLRHIRSKIGLVFQDPDDQLFMPAVFDDVAFGPVNMGLDERSVVPAVERALEKVDMTAAIRRPSHHLSLGEKKRISIATVLSMDPEILVLDEPTSNIDPRHRRELIGLINSLGHTKIIATHDIGLVKRCCSKVAVFHEGSVPVFDTTGNVLGNNGILEKYGLNEG